MAMSTLELSLHPELAQIADQLRNGQVVVFTDHGQVLGEAQPVVLDRGAWLADLAVFRASLGVSASPNAVLEQRAEDER
jgi:hypothetical protein